MQQLKDILENKFSKNFTILEKLRINKNTEFNSDAFVFKPKESDPPAKAISDLTVYLPFDILVNNKRKISIAKIKYEFINQYKFDSWKLYDDKDNLLMHLTNNGIKNLLLIDGEFETTLEGESKISSIIIIKSSLNIIKESSLNEKLKINEESSLNEKLKINKETEFDWQSEWADKDEWTKYKYDALYYILNLIKDKINWNKSITSISYLTFDDTTLTAKDLDELSKTLGKDNILDTHEWIWDGYKKSCFIVNIFKQKLIEIHNSLMHQNKYNLSLCGDAVDFYKKYYKDICKK